MIKNWKLALSSAVLSLSVLGAGAALTSTAHAQTATPAMRNEYWSNSNVHHARVRLEGIIDNLKRDQRDYGGQREQAIDLLQQARQHLLLAEQWEKSHPNQ